MVTEPTDTPEPSPPLFDQFDQHGHRIKPASPGRKQRITSPVTEHPQPDPLGRYLCITCKESFTANRTPDGRPIHGWCLPPYYGSAFRYMQDLAQGKIPKNSQHFGHTA